MVSKLRAHKISERIREELSEMLLREMTDPRLTGISITEVAVDRELAYAKIYISALEGPERKDDILSGLEHAKGFIRYHLSHRLDLRSFPQLRFKWDPTPENAEKIERLLASLADSENPVPEEEKETSPDD